MNKFLMIIFGTTIFLACCDDPDQCATILKIPVSFEHAHNVFTLRDTIVFKSKFSTTVRGFNTTMDFVGDFDCAHIDWKPVLFVHKLDTLDQSRNSYVVPYFDYDVSPRFNPRIDFSLESSFLLADYEVHNDSFNLELNLIPQKPGLFMIGITSDEFMQQSFEGCCNECRGGFDIYVDMLSNSKDNYAELLKESPSQLFYEWTYNDLERNFHRIGGIIVRIDN